MNRNGGVLDGADQAAQKAYSAGKQMGMTDDGAHDFPKQTYDNYVQRYSSQPKVDAPAGQGAVNPIGGTEPGAGSGSSGGTATGKRRNAPRWKVHHPAGPFLVNCRRRRNRSAD